MKTLSILAVGLFPLALAINQPKQQCANFLSIRIINKHSRGRRSPMEWGLFGDDDGSADDSDDWNTSTGTAVTNSAVSSAQTQGPTTVATEPASPQTKGPTTAQSSQADPTTADPITNESPTTDPATVSQGQTQGPTTEKITKAPTTLSTNAQTTVTSGTENKKAIIVMLDETGSMQDIGGKRKGRNLVIRKMEQFRKMLNNKVQKNRLDDQEITFVTFNVQATWTTYGSLDQWRFGADNYNPGYQTNLFDTMGCVLSEFKARNPNTDASVYLISDGVHALNWKLKGTEAYKDSEVKEMVEELRDDGWNFNFYGATDVAGKEELKAQASDIGFRAAETLVFDFNGQQFGALLKTMLKTMVGNDKEIEKEEQAKKLPTCKKCPKGRAGKMCRKAKKNQIAAGLCVKA